MNNFKIKKGTFGIFPIVVSIVVHTFLFVCISAYIPKNVENLEYMTVSFEAEKQIQTEAAAELNKKIERKEEAKRIEETKTPLQKTPKNIIQPPKPKESSAMKNPEQAQRLEEPVPPSTPPKSALPAHAPPAPSPPAPAREIQPPPFLQPPPPVSTVQVATWKSSDGKSDIPSGDGKITDRLSHKGIRVAGPDSGEAREGSYGGGNTFGAGSGNHRGSGSNLPGSVNGNSGTGGSAKKETSAGVTGMTHNPTPAIPPKDKNKIIQEYQKLIISIIEKNKIYPAQAQRKGIEGYSKVSFTLSQNGDISDISISESSGYNFFDTESANIFKRIGKFPPPPAEIVKGSRKMNLTIYFILSNTLAN